MALKFVILVIAGLAVVMVAGQGPYYPNHWYGGNTETIRSGRVPPKNTWPEPHRQVLDGYPAGTLAPHVCGFNPFLRKCMDPEGVCPGRCMNFNYKFNARYDCRCLVI
uniref:Secreted protein n=1 Tax=Panagrellus redivivus TaxID=6233 RepID=A0A7E4W8T7_PANRE